MSLASVCTDWLGALCQGGTPWTGVDVANGHINLKSASCLRKKTKRVLLALGTCKFYERLEAKCAVKQVLLVNGDESYTSKGCDNCGRLNRRLGGSEVFHCAACGHHVDRDVHSARGILRKNSKLFILA